MNKRMVFYILCRMMFVEAVLLLIPALVSAIYGETGSLTVFLVLAAAVAALSLPGALIKPKNSAMFARESLVIVALAWILWSVIGALPFVIDGCIPDFISAVFESTSGFTTMGGSILNDVESLSHGMLFWRSFTHFIGGMGVLVFVMAVIPLSDSASIHLMRAEMPGPVIGKLVPKGRSTAKVLYIIYLAMTVLLFILLVCGGMPVFDSIIHSMGTAGTGGFSCVNESIGHYDSAYIDTVITVFMILFGVNFNLFYFALLGRIGVFFKNRELRTYLGLYLAAAVSISIAIRPLYGNIFTSFRYAAFQAASVMSTTGFSTADFDLWPEFAKVVLLLLMVVGGCAGSTGGGMKVSRILILLRTAKSGLKRTVSPRSVDVIRGDEGVLGSDTIFAVLLYVTIYVLVLIFSVILISFDNFDFTTNFTAVLTCLNDVGPGLNLVGPTQNFSIFSGFAKIVLSFDMLFGRLEFVPLVILFAPSTWRKKFM